MEIRDLYDENKVLTGETIEKGAPVPKGRYYITVLVWIMNKNGELLLQQRVPSKDNKWATTGGHPVSGESSLDGIKTEIKEELGLDASNIDIELINTERTEDDFVDMYFTKWDVNIDNVKIQEEEVQDVKWASREEIERMIANGEFSNSHAEFYNTLVKYLDK